jgi:formyl-CoA transferase
VTGSPRGPLDGIRVLELGNFIAAPTAGRLLADFGAEVIKVERPHVGDEIRTWRLYDGDTSMLYRTINRNKKSVEIDLRTAAGRSAVLRLAALSDVVIENFRPGTLERWGLGPDELERVRPGIIISRISAFGQTGPLSHRPGFAAVAEAFGGFRELVGDPDRPPVRVGVSIGDSIAGIYSAFGVVMSLFQGLRAPEGVSLEERTTDVALYEAMFSMMESLIPDYLAYGTKRERVGGRVEGIAPTNSYLCADGKSVVIAGNGDAIYLRLMEVIGRPDLAADPELQSNSARWQHRDRIDEAIGAWTGRHAPQDVLDALEAADVPAGLIFTADDIASNDHYRARRMIQYFDVETGQGINRVGFPGVVPVTGGASRSVRWPGPDLGAHNGEVLGGLLGMSEAEIDGVSGRQESGG